MTLENFVKSATCRVICENECGTGHLVTDSLVLTAHHCVAEAIDKGNAITLVFAGENGDISLEAAIVAYEEKIDVCLLSISHVFETPPIKLNATLPSEGEMWLGYGYPSSRMSVRHRISGTISQTFDTVSILKTDIDLTIESGDLNNYDGLSGSAMVCKGASYGMIRLKLDGTLGAISVFQMGAFLLGNGVVIDQDIDNEDSSTEAGSSLAEREEFQHEFEQNLANSSGKYLLLEGANGIGKTTFCNSFRPEDPSLCVLGTYSFGLQGRGPGAAYRIQPDVFFAWLSTTISTTITGKPARLVDEKYSKLVENTNQLLNQFSEYCKSRNQKGVLFIDGLNEALEVGNESFSRFVGLLPSVLSDGITVVLTALSFEGIATPLAGRVSGSSRIVLPLLNNDVVREYCIQEIREDRATPALITRLCTKAQGHPLYLRYLIEYVNNGPADDELNDFPIFAGAIGEYYEVLWSRLVGDSDAVNLLAIIARLRWGIHTEDLVKTLNTTEQAAFIPTLRRIQHLLLNTNDTTIYHASFSEFLVSKTLQLDSVIHGRLAEFCVQEAKLEYSVLNLVFHFLHFGDAGRLRAVGLCSQSWVDHCVTLEIEPDTLLFDIEKVLDAAVHLSSTVEVVRILLLLQRISFRYNNLFAQSADLMAKALIALKRPRDAVHHVIRFNRLIISPDETMQVAFDLIQGKHSDEAIELLTMMYDRIAEECSHGDLTLNIFIDLYCIRIFCILFMELADGNARTRQAFNIMAYAINTIGKNLDESCRDDFASISAEVQVVIPSYSLCFKDRYTNTAKLSEMRPVLPENMLELLLRMLLQVRTWLDSLKLTKVPTVLPEVYADIEALAAAGACLDKQSVPAAVDTLIYLGAPYSVVQSIAAYGESFSPKSMDIKAANGADVDDRKFYQDGSEWRVAAFLSSELDCPAVSSWSEVGWLETLESLASALFWCEGKARRACADSDKALQNEVSECLRLRILPLLTFSLAERIRWENSYAIPEKVLPLLYEQLTELYVDCYPQELSSFIAYLLGRMDNQCGIYSEGFREILFLVFSQLINREVDSSTSDEIFDLLQKFKQYVIQNVENRHELIPELLRLIPLFVKLDAEEEAQRIYQHMLSVSMGPSWYKEAQFELMVSTLSSMPLSNNVDDLLPQVAGYLEHASGEMTFQRFVRYDKAALIAELCRREKHSQAVQYFKRQTCGTQTELYLEACHGELDRAEPMVGMRYPGGALDEQDAILKIIQNVEQADWQLCWALLEIYLCGDERHLSDYAIEYAKLINRLNHELQDVMLAVERVRFIVGAELNPDQRLQFLSAFEAALDPVHHPAFSDILKQLPTKNPVNEPSATSVNEEDLADISDDEQHGDRLLLPGTFGSQSSTREADIALVKAEAFLRRKNYEVAKRHAVESLLMLQKGGWSIWGNLSRNAAHAEGLLREGVQNAEEVIRLYAPLLLNERFTDKWRLAEHLIEKVAGLLSEHDRRLLAQCVMDHIKLMVGDSAEHTKTYSFLKDESPRTVNTELFELILWLLDHPKWLRREKAADMLVWLLESKNTYLESSVKLAFSMDNSYKADVLCGVLDGMSHQQPLHLWEQIFSIADIDTIIQNCKHISRLGVLCRIVERATHVGSLTAPETASRMNELLSSRVISANVSVDFSVVPDWADCIAPEWEKLKSLGMADNRVFSMLEAEVVKLCVPLDINTAWNLEKMVSKGFREPEDYPLNRWEAKISYALNLALFASTPQEHFKEVESILRIYNPSLLHLTREVDIPSIVDTASIAIINRGNINHVKGNKELILLHYKEYLGHEDNGSAYNLEVTAIMTTSYDGFTPKAPSEDALFGSFELPVINRKIPGYETCQRVSPQYAFLGALTPAVPSSDFVKLINGNDSYFLRKNWKNGRSQQIKRPMREGCLLVARRSNVRLPHGWAFAWIVKLNGNIIGIFK